MLIFILTSNISDPTQKAIDKTYSIHNNTSYFLDISNKLTLTDLLKKPDLFIKAPLSNIPWSFTQQTYWLNMQLKNNTPQNYALVAHFDNPMLDVLEVVQLNSNKKIIKQNKMGDLNFKLTLSEQNLPSFEFNIASKQQTRLLIKIKTTGVAKTPIRIYEAHDFLTLSKDTHLIWGIFIGIMLMIALYNLVLFFGIKDSVYLIYISYILSVIMQMGVVLGFGNLLWPDFIHSFFQKNIISLNYLVAICTLFFAIFFLHYHKEKGKLYNIGIYYASIMTLFGVISLWLPEYIAAQIFFVFLFFFYLVSFILIIAKLKTNFNWAKFYIISWLPLIIGAAIQPMMLTGIIEYSFLARYAFMIGVLLEVTLMAMALAERMRHQKEIAFYNATHDQDLHLPNLNFLESTMQSLIDTKRKFSICLIEVLNFNDISPYITNEESAALVSHIANDINNYINLDSHFLYFEQKPDTLIKIAKAKDGVLAVLVSRFINVQELTNQLTQMQNSLSKDIKISGLLIDLKTKIGIFSVQEDTHFATVMIKKAFQALEQAKRESLNLSFYQMSETYNIAQKLTLATELQLAIHNNDLHLFHQPQINLKDASVHGSEVLLRWQHPIHGFVSPDMFIRIAEDTGIINELTMWVLNTACQQLNTLVSKGYDQHSLSINISGKDIAMQNFLSKVKNILSHFNTPTHLLNFELTESVMVSDFQHLSNLMSKLSVMGIQVSVDDYGTGYSSLTYISQLPFNELKIDKSFILDLADSTRHQTIVKTTIDMAKSLKLKVVAEGVESAEIEKILTDCHCDLVQGYYYSKPLPFEQYLQWLENYTQQDK
ncbi:EAL domain-containing protein [Pseudoalteromonas denitrificans]|uniref:Diguanylate cyclase/phosphodiesterase n=1 Tax=Pseudoalteromonas denitrificans DSM 6059 TaxID=1123010 RepID=A0A1I1J521_9GAMM|nr:EAL domain-containing protein [Pseudoalteromonas denitrificans]SFC43719.1 diguanylate cyclase/phosphodiesterase [Pseudoalteromonas denitrificans DSM 6059]